MIEIKGKSGIVAKILADSVNEQGNRLTTFELTYPRMVHSEILTHKMLCSNSASSRAIPFAKMAEQLTARPVRFGQANPGMQDRGEDFDKPVPWHDDEYMEYESPPTAIWEMAKMDALVWAGNFYEAGYHKQVYNRIIEPFQMMKTVISGTEWDNFFWLRNDSAADPTLHELARCMQEARNKSVPQLLKAGEWHLPYVRSHMLEDKGKSQAFYIETDGNEYPEITLDQAIKVSCARTAAVSFRNEDYGLEKCLEVYARLIGDERKHASAFQHQATPLNKVVYENDKYDFSVTDLNRSVNLPYEPETWQEGVSHVDKSGNLWSAQFKGWMMYRKTITGENYVNPVV